MEFMGFKECINFLLGYGTIITNFISDRDVSIASHKKKVLTGITHYCEIWHLKKSKNQTQLESVIIYNVTYTPVSMFQDIAKIGMFCTQIDYYLLTTSLS